MSWKPTLEQITKDADYGSATLLFTSCESQIITMQIAEIKTRLFFNPSKAVSPQIASSSDIKLITRFGQKNKNMGNQTMSYSVTSHLKNKHSLKNLIQKSYNRPKWAKRALKLSRSENLRSFPQSKITNNTNNECSIHITWSVLTTWSTKLISIFLVYLKQKFSTPSKNLSQQNKLMLVHS